MGRTWKATPEEYFHDDFMHYEQNESELDDRIDSQWLNGKAKRHRGHKAHRFDLDLDLDLAQLRIRETIKASAKRPVR